MVLQCHAGNLYITVISLTPNCMSVVRWSGEIPWLSSVNDLNMEYNVHYSSKGFVQGVVESLTAVTCVMKKL